MPCWNFTFTQELGSAFAMRPRTTIDLISLNLENSFINTDSANINFEDINAKSLIYVWDDFNLSIENTPFTWDQKKYLGSYLIGYTGQNKETFHDKDTLDDPRKMNPSTFYKIRLYTTDFGVGGDAGKYVGETTQLLTLRGNVTTIGTLVAGGGTISREKGKGLFHRSGLSCESGGHLTMDTLGDYSNFVWNCWININQWNLQTGTIFSLTDDATTGWSLTLAGGILSANFYDSGGGLVSITLDCDGRIGWNMVTVKMINDVGSIIINDSESLTIDLAPNSFVPPAITDVATLSADSLGTNTIDASYDCLSFFVDDNVGTTYSDASNMSDTILNSIYGNSQGNDSQGYHHTDNTPIFPLWEFQFEDKGYAVAQGFADETYSRTKWEQNYENISISYVAN